MRISRRELLALAAAFPSRGRPKGEAAPKVEVEVLGTAQDGGLPQLGCAEERCRRARENPAFSRRVASLGVRADSSLFLVDASPDIRSQIAQLQSGLERGRKPVDGILLTHAHIGHYLGLALLGRESIGAREVPVFCSARMASYLRGNGPWSLVVSSGHLRLVEISPGVTFELGPGLRVEAIAVPHRGEFTDTVGFLLSGRERRLLYIPDIDRWEALSPPIEDLARRAEVLILDGTFWNPTAEIRGRDVSQIPHPPIPDTLRRLAPLAGSRRILLTHLNHTNPAWDRDSPERKEIERAGFGVAEEEERFGL